MKTLPIAAAAIAFAAAAHLVPAMGEELSPPATNAWQGAPQAFNGQVPAAAAPHYEWQYHYRGRHARYEGGWVLVR